MTDSHNSFKNVKNSLLLTAKHGFEFSSNSQPLLMPVAKNELPVTEELDNFIGQESATPAGTSDHLFSQSVPLVVPSDQKETPSNSSFTNNTVSNSVNVPSTTHNVQPNSAAQTKNIDWLLKSSTEKNYSGELAHSVAAEDNSSPLRFFNPNHFKISSPEKTPTVVPPVNQRNDPEISNRSVDHTVATGSNLPPPPPPTGPANNYRLGNLKRPAYAQIPTLQSPTTTAPKLFTSAEQLPAYCARSLNLADSTAASSKIGALASSVSQPSLISNINMPPPMYHPVYHHWFYRLDLESNWFYPKDSESKTIWKPFSMNDSLALESAFSLPTVNNRTTVSTDGGRYDVHVFKREKIAVYWEEAPILIRRCSWFFRNSSDSNYIPYEEEIAAELEEQYKLGLTTNSWPRIIDVADNEEVVMRSNSSILQQIKSVRAFEDMSTEPSQSLHLKPRLVKRGGFDEFDISDGEPETIDHLLFLVHGIGQFCDIKFRSIIEVVDEFRILSTQLLQSHFQESCDTGTVNRIEILPISWHQALHSEDTGVDNRLKNITLPSIPKLRDFANDTILDVLFYNSPVYCQVIINTVTFEINRLHALFVKRNPNFTGKISVGGHSLGSLILYDILSHQSSSYKPTLKRTDELEENDVIQEDDEASSSDKRIGRKRPMLTRRVSYVTVGHAGTGQPYVKYSHLHFSPRNFFAFGSPIAAFIATRSSEILGEDFKFPTCPKFFNIFHPYDPIAYRIEPLINPQFSNIKPVQVLHHKGRKRMHLELRETVSNVGQKLYDTVKNTWNMMYQLAATKTSEESENEVRRLLSKFPTNPNLMAQEPTADGTADMKVGKLNEGKRIDYVLQEAPVEYINEYLFALASHLCYWTSRDTMLLVLREIYGDIGILPQSCPADISSSHRLTPSPPAILKNQNIDPTLPIKDNVNLGPPPTSGFFKK